MINVIEITKNFDLMVWLFGAMAILGAMKLIIKLAMGR